MFSHVSVATGCIVWESLHGDGISRGYLGKHPEGVLEGDKHQLNQVEEGGIGESFRDIWDLGELRALGAKGCREHHPFISGPITRVLTLWFPLLYHSGTMQKQ